MGMIHAGSHHFVCCVDISTPENSSSPHGNSNPLMDVIKAASKPSSYSWCTCSEEICTSQLGELPISSPVAIKNFPMMSACPLFSCNLVVMVGMLLSIDLCRFICICHPWSHVSSPHMPMGTYLTSLC